MKRWFCALLCLAVTWAIVGMGARQPPATAGENLLGNPGFEESGSAGWEESGGLFELVTAPYPVHSGNQAAQHQDSGSERDKWLEHGVQIAGGKTYHVGAWVQAPVEGPEVRRVYIVLEWHDLGSCGGAQLGVSVADSIQPVPTGAWSELSGTVAAPVDARCATLRLAFEPAPGQDPIVYWDDAFVGLEDAGDSSPTATGTSQVTLTPTSLPSQTPTPTPTPALAPSPTPSATPTLPAGGIVLNEFMAHPDNGDEYVELFNANPSPVNVEGWLIDDGLDGGGFRLPAGAVLAAHGHGVWVRNFRLNNDGDTVRLFAPNGSLIDSVGYA